MTIKLLSERNFFLLAVSWTIIIALLSLIKFDVELQDLSFIQGKDKVVHFIFYFLFVFFWSLALYKKDLKLKILFIAILYGMIIEVLQDAITATRTSDLYDVLANSLGALVAYIFLKKNIKKISKHF